MIIKAIGCLCLAIFVLQNGRTEAKVITDSDLNGLEKDLASILSHQNDADQPEKDSNPPKPVRPGFPEAPFRDDGLTDDENKQKIDRLLQILTKKNDGSPPGFKPERPGFPEAPSRDNRDGLTDDENKQKIDRLLQILAYTVKFDKNTKENDGSPPRFKPKRSGFPEAPSRDSKDSNDIGGYPPGFKPKRPGFPEAPSRDNPEIHDSHGFPPGFKPKRPGFPEAPSRDNRDSHDSDGFPPGFKPKRPGFPEAPSRDNPDSHDSGFPPGFKPKRPGFPEAPSRDIAEKDIIPKELLEAGILRADEEIKRRKVGFAKDGRVFKVPYRLPAPLQPESSSSDLSKKEILTSMLMDELVRKLKDLHKRGEPIPNRMANLLMKYKGRRSF